LDAIGAIGEVIGAVAVFVTLAYLAVQIRQNTHSVSTSIYESAMAGFKENNRYFADLWKEMDRHKLEEFSSFDFGDEPRQRS
jgi:hypothetical protein